MTPAILRYIDVLIVVLAAPFALVMGAPVLGFAVGVGGWCVQRLAGELIERRAASMPDPRRALTATLVSSMGRVWVLALMILAVGKAGTRPDGLTAALVILVAFTIHFSMNLVTRSTQGRRAPTT